MSRLSVRLRAGIVDFGMGNLFSVKVACQAVGMDPFISANPSDFAAADLVILPGVGAFPDAMANLRANKLDSMLSRVVDKDRPLVGICLGLQLLFSESEEFGCSMGLNLVPGRVRSLRELTTTDVPGTKIPNVGWAGIRQNANESAFIGLQDAEPMYFVHRYYVEPDEDAAVSCRAEFAGVEFCAGIRYGSMIGFQFHPERSGLAGLQIYANIRDWAARRNEVVV